MKKGGALGVNPGPLGVAKHNYPEGKRVDDAPNQSKGKLQRIRADPLKMQNCRKKDAAVGI